MHYQQHFEHKRSPDLDGARGVLALSVVFYHFGLNSFIARLTHGACRGLDFRLCVDAFFILSGYVLTGSLRQSNPGPGYFARKRFFRLAPMFYLTTAAALFLPPPGYAWSTVSLELLAAQPAIMREAANGPSWSVTWEFYLPILACVAAPWMPQVTRPQRTALLVFALAALGVIDCRLAQEDGFYLARSALGLFSGHCLYLLYCDHRLRWRAWMTPTLLIAVLGTMLAAMVTWAAALVFPFVVCAMVFSGATNSSKVLSSRPAQWLGAISYTLYMVHVPVMRAAQLAAGPAFAQNSAAKCAGIAASLVLATALTRWFEVPLIDLGRTRRLAPLAQ